MKNYFRFDHAHVISQGFIVLADSKSQARQKLNGAAERRISDTNPDNPADWPKLSNYDSDIVELPERVISEAIELRPIGVLVGDSNESASEAFAMLARLKVTASSIQINLDRADLRERQP